MNIFNRTNKKYAVEVAYQKGVTQKKVSAFILFFNELNGETNALPLRDIKSHDKQWHIKKKHPSS